MRKYVWIGCGGFIGAIARYLLKGVPLTPYNGPIPLNILLINITGAFLLGLVLTTAFEGRELDPDIRLGIATGFLGAFTTFSTMCKEIVGLLAGGDFASAALYMAVSVALGFAASSFGVLLARAAGSRLSKQWEKDVE